jgi:hypothetical protein
VTWQRLVNVTLSGSSLAKTGGCDGCADAGAISVEQLSADGYVEFRASETGPLRFIGLGAGQAGTSPSEITFSLRLQGQFAEVREKGTYRADTSFVTGDVFRVQVANGKVSYLKNGVTFYTSGGSPFFPLMVDTSFLSMGGTLDQVVIGGGTAGAPAPSPSPTPAPAPGTPLPIVWINGVNVLVSPTTISKNGGCNGCGDSGAVSQQVIDLAKGGFVEYIAQPTGVHFVGLTYKNQPEAGLKLPFALRFDSTRVDVRERGNLKFGTTFAAGDRFRITVANGRVVYSKNGVTFYTSARLPEFQLRAAVSLYGMVTIASPTMLVN